MRCEDSREFMPEQVTKKRDSLRLKQVHKRSGDGNSATRSLLKESLATKLREEILAGRIAPGEKITEGRWARQFGVAQVSIREALNILTADGYVTKGHGRSARVLKLRDRVIFSIFTFVFWKNPEIRSCESTGAGWSYHYTPSH